jgi:hypothetical protein
MTRQEHATMMAESRAGGKLDHATEGVWSGVLANPIRTAAILIGLLACQPPASSGVPANPEPSLQVDGEAGPSELPPAVAIEGLPDPPVSWPEPVPTITSDGALSIRALRLDPEPLLAGAAAGQVVRVRVLVQGQEPEEGEPIRTWCVDRTIDLSRLDQGMPIEPPLRASEPGRRIELIATLERRALAEGEQPTLVLHPLAWTDEAKASWQTAEGAPVEPGSWPAQTEPSPLLRRAMEDRPLALGRDLAEALDFLARAALADDGALAERHARRALELAPADVEAWSTLIAIYHGYGQHEHHLAAMRAAAARIPGELDELWLDYGSIDVTIGEFRHAIPLLEQAIVLAPASLPAHFYLATAHWLLDERSEARPGYEKVVELAGPVHTAIEFLMIDTARNRLAELDRG